MLKLAAAVALTLGFASAAHADCKLMEVAKLPIEVRGNLAFIEGKLRGEPMRMLVATGDSMTMFDLNFAKKAGLSIEDSAYRTVTKAGEIRMQQATINDWEIGNMKAPSRRLLLSPNGFRGFAGVLGFDFFSKFDFELNLKANEIKLFDPQGCGDSVLAYWAPDKADMVEMLEGGRHNTTVFTLHLPIKLNGTQFRAVLDTGAPTSVAGRKVADYFGINVTAAAKGTVLTNKFDSFEIGSETIKNPTLRVADVMSDGFGDTGSHLERRDSFAEFRLGADFIRAHRIFVSNSQHRVYFTYEGGPVFPTPQNATAASK